MKRSKSVRMIGTLTSIAMAASLAGCDSPPPMEDKTPHQDKYTSLEDCIADWGDTDLCLKQQEEARKRHEIAVAEAKRAGSSVPVFIPIFSGPTYYGSDRSYTQRDGTKYTPATSRATSTAALVSQNGKLTTVTKAPIPAKVGATGGVTSTGIKTALPKATSSAKAPVAKATGGFGSTGRAMSAGSGGG